jgi:ATP-dependent DNA helicase DinG
LEDSARIAWALLGALIARWARFTRDGDMVGGDFPSWLLSLFSDVALDYEARALSPSSLSLTDRRGECIYSAIPQFKKTFLSALRVPPARQYCDCESCWFRSGGHCALGVLKGRGARQWLTLVFGEPSFLMRRSAFPDTSRLETSNSALVHGPETEKRRRGRGLIDRIKPGGRQ